MERGRKGWLRVMIDEAVEHIEQAIALLEKADRTVYWVMHFEEDLKSLKLLAQARRATKAS
jgi:hypothetical protein